MGYLEFLTGKLVGTANVTDVKSPYFLKALTKPFTKISVQLDKKLLKGWVPSSPVYENATPVLKPGYYRHEARGPSCKYLFAHLGSDVSILARLILVLSSLLSLYA